MYFSPSSQKNVTMCRRLGLRACSWRAATRCAPELGPTNSPSCRARRRISPIATSLSTATISSMTCRCRAKMPGTKPSEMPSMRCWPTSPLGTHPIRHDDEHPVALHRSDHAHRVAGVAAARLHDGVTRPQQPFPLRPLDHVLGDTRLDRSGRVEVLELDPDPVTTISGVLPIASRIVPPPRGSKPVAGSRAVPAAEHAAGTFAPSAAERATLMESSRTQPWEPLGDVDELNVNAVPRRRRIALLAACAQEIHPRPTRPRQATRCPGREFPDAARPICSARRALEHMLLITHDWDIQLSGVDLRPTLQNLQVRPESGSETPTLASGR